MEHMTAPGAFSSQ